MLLAIRERVMGIVGWVLLGLLAVAFSFFGLSSYLGDSTRTYAASVNDVEISLAALRSTYQQMRTSLQSQLGDSYDPAMIDEDMIRKSALQKLIHEQLLLQAAEADGFAVSKERLAAEISSIGAFRDGDAFSSQKYENILRNQGMSTSQFERRLSRELLTQQLLTGITGTAASTPGIVTDLYRLQAQQRRFRYVTVPVSAYAGKEVADAAEIEKYYQENGKEFMSPERIRVNYIELVADNLEVNTEVNDDALKALYDEQSEKYVIEEQRQARHILLRLPPDSDVEAVADSRIKAQLLLERLENGEDFAELASAESDDPGSAANGGDLGFFGKGVMAPIFEAAVFALEEGERSDVVQTTFGFHIIEVTGIKPEIATPFEDVRDKLVHEYLAEVRNDLFYEYSENLANAAFENPDSLDSAASELNVEIMTSDWLTRDGGPGIGEYPEMVEAAFQRDVLESGNNSEPIEVADNHQVVIRLLDHEPAEAQPLESVREEITRKLDDLKARKLARQEGKNLLQELRSGTPLVEIAKKLDTALLDSGLVTRTAGKPDRAIIQEAFLLTEPEKETPSLAGLVMENGDYVVMSLEEIRDGDMSVLSEADRKQVTRDVSSLQGRSEIDAMINTLKDNATIIIPADNDQDSQP
ncbi:MAG: SurA N-terminal domain-containing protein [Thiohalobacterales bacterium]